MKFTKTIGKVDKAKVQAAEDKLTSVFTELSLSYDNKQSGSGLGGDPFLFQLVFPVEQICVGEVPNDQQQITTAATDGKKYFWSPEFVIGLSRIGLRFVVAHEAFHAIYMHPNRRGSRLPWLWNIAVDYIVNYNIMADLKTRGFDPAKMFKDHLGEFVELKRYADALTGKAEIPRESKHKKVFYADPNLAPELRKPEAIYEWLFRQMAKCPKCNKLMPGKQNQKNKGQKPGDQDPNGNQKQKGKGNKPGDGDGDGDQDQKGKGKGKGKGKQPGDGHDHGDGDGQGDQPGQGGGNGHCDHGDPCDFGALLDDHMDAEASQDELAKRLADAAEISRRLAGRVPGGMEDEIGQLLAPKLRWQDVIRSKIQRVRQGHGRQDWNRFKTRPLFAGLMIPKKKDFFARFHVLLDTSGSMSAEDMAWGLSQLQAIDERGEGTITPADAEIYWDKSVKIKRANRDEISKVKIVGRGGTAFMHFFDHYEKELGPADFIIVLTDGYLSDLDFSKTPPKIPVYWILTASHNFTAPYGKILNLHNE